MSKVLILMSGGVDSTVLAHLAGDRLGGLLFIDYGQPAADQERRAVHQWAAPRGVEVIGLACDLSGVDDHMRTGVGSNGLRILPGRNLIFAAHAINVAKSRGWAEVWIGANAGDEPYPDCRPAWVSALDALSQADTGIRLVAPLVGMTKAEIIERAMGERIDLAQTWSCYQPTPTGAQCGTCHSCLEGADAPV
tara:strand:- start:112 stop:690 length:579 start_codon:yes stop_codon:yes gene_type:complete